MKSKPPKDSAIETRYIIMPEHTNHYGTAFGGVIISWIDIAGAMVAEKHCGHEAVTVSIDSLSFLNPIYVGEHVLLKASVNYVGNSSMEIGVKVIKENPFTGDAKVVTKAYLTFIGLDKNRQPVKIFGLSPETDDEKRRYENAKIRSQTRKELKDKIK